MSLGLEAADSLKKAIQNSLYYGFTDKHLPSIGLASLYWRKLQLESALC